MSLRCLCRMASLWGMRRTATLVRRRRTMQASQAVTKRSCAMPRQRRWEPNKRLVHERERRGWSQDDAAREAERVAGGLGLPDLVFTGAQFGRWERGECRPRPPLRRVVCELYDASAEALGLLDQGDGAANRRDLLRNAVVLGAAAVVSPAWRREELAGAAVEPAEVASIRDALMNYDGIWADEVANACRPAQPQPPSSASMASPPGACLSAARRATAPRADQRPARRAHSAGDRPAAGVNGLLAETYQCVACHGEYRAARSCLGCGRPGDPRGRTVGRSPDGRSQYPDASPRILGNGPLREGRSR